MGQGLAGCLLMLSKCMPDRGGAGEAARTAVISAGMGDTVCSGKSGKPSSECPKPRCY